MFSRKSCIGTREIAQLVKCFPFKQEDLSLIHLKIVDVVAGCL